MKIFNILVEKENLKMMMRNKMNIMIRMIMGVFLCRTTKEDVNLVMVLINLVPRRVFWK